ncbi:hypothetical protein [Sphingomonas arenae]|uniref:hypothetical protein n=1 Tax=Sphingomonas arenae TaxID=2812555 RepID=UPI0019681F24|nr:hypothetical protein [Sphingomonas arenae]
MHPTRQRAVTGHEPFELTDALPAEADPVPEQVFEPAVEQASETGAGGRQVLGWTLSILAVLWLAFAGWSAGLSLSAQSISAPALAQWLAIAAGPLALLGLGWLLFGRTRRRETERFTQAVAGMRSEARSLEGVLSVLRQRIDEEQAALSQMAERLMHLGDETTHRLGGVTRELGSGAQTLAQHSAALDRAAESARNDIGVLLEDLPRAEASARAMAEELRGSGRDATAQAAALEAQLAAITSRTREADEVVGGASQRLVAHLTQIESAGAAAATRISDVASNATSEIDTLLERTALALSEIRRGIDTQSAAVSALVEQSAAGMGRSSLDAADALAMRLGTASSALDQLSARLAEQDRASQRLIADVERGLADLDHRFVDLAAEGDLRADAIAKSVGQVRSELDQLARQAASSDGSLESLADRTAALREAISGLQADIGNSLSGALGEAEGGAERLLAAVQASRPEIEWMREAATEASERLALSADNVAAQQDRLAALLATLDDGVGSAEQRLASLREAIASAEADASRVQAETAPALVQAMVQVREASAHAAERAREALAAVIPDSAAQLSEATREALERAIREGVEQQLREVESVATRALEAARSASERLTAQMLSIGQTAAALEAHMERTSEAQQAADSEAFARRVAMLIDSMHSASIDVGKILSDEVDEKAWSAYLKGDRGVFTRRAVRLLGNSEARQLSAQYDIDGEFQTSVNRYVHDFEAMLRRVAAERDGGMLAVTLMSSDMGKLYAALAPVVERRR